MPLFASLVKHGGLLGDVLAIVARVSALEGGAPALKASPGALEAEKRALSPDVAAAWARVKAVRQWIRGKKSYYQKYG